jgi:hypothetical protein
MITVLGALINGIMFLYDLIYLQHYHFQGSIYYNKFTSILMFLSVMVVLALLFVCLIPSLELHTHIAVFRSTEDCAIFEDSPTHICFSPGKKYYTTPKPFCGGGAGSDPFYIISSWIPSKDEYTLNRRIYFHPDNVQPSFWIPEETCVQEFTDDGHPSTDDLLRVALTSTTTATGFIDRSDLKEYHEGWYRVSNCRWEILRLLPGYCTTGYISNTHINLSSLYLALLHETNSAAI